MTAAILMHSHSWSTRGLLVVNRGHSWSFVVTRGHSCVLLDTIEKISATRYVSTCDVSGFFDSLHKTCTRLAQVTQWHDLF